MGKILSGPRCKCSLQIPGQAAIPLGIFSRVSWQVQLDLQPAFILGRFTAASLDHTAAEPVSINATGWRVVDAGAHAAAGVPKIQDLLTTGYLVFDIEDRQTGKIIAHITEVKATGYSGDLAAKSLSEMPVSYMGIKHADESGPQDESAGAANLP